jgi:hypothetical protein
VTVRVRDRLADDLRKACLPELSERARRGYCDDIDSPLAMPAIELAKALERAGTSAAVALRARHLEGEFAVGRDEFAAWSRSAAGRLALRRLIDGA